MTAPFNPSSLVVPIGIGALILWRFYSRARRMVGRQRLSNVRPWVTVCAFPILTVLLATASIAQPMSPLALVEGVADALAPNAQKKKLQLTTFVDASVPPMVEGDPVRLRQILFNLIGNAIKFTEQGEIAVRLSAGVAGPDRMMLRVLVRDTGIGLSPESRVQLWIMPTNEELIVARQAMNLLASGK